MRYTILLLSLALIFSCEKDETILLTITSFAPERALAGEDVVITGTGFSNSSSDNVVRFGSAVAQVKATTTDQITATVPANAVTDFITVQANGQEAKSAKEFVVRKAPEIISVFSNVVSIGGETTIDVRNVGTDAAKITVRVNSVKGDIIRVTQGTENGQVKEQITFKVPVVASGGYLTVEYDGLTATWPEKIEVLPYVTGFTPKGGPNGTEITIEGLNFIPGEMSVSVYGKAATVTSTTSTTIKATVTNSVFGPVTVTRNLVNYIAPEYFMGTTFSINNPTKGPVGTWVELFFTGSPRSNQPVVKFNGVTATEVDFTNGIKARVPAGATTGKVTLAFGGFTSTSTNDFVVE